MGESLNPTQEPVEIALVKSGVGEIGRGWPDCFCRCAGLSEGRECRRHPGEQGLRGFSVVEMPAVVEGNFEAAAGDPGIDFECGSTRGLG